MRVMFGEANSSKCRVEEYSEIVTLTLTTKKKEISGQRPFKKKEEGK